MWRQRILSGAVFLTKTGGVGSAAAKCGAFFERSGSVAEQVASATCFARVRLPPPPPDRRYANTIPEANAFVFGRCFGIIVSTADFDTETHSQSKKATSNDIQTWVMQTYGEHVTNLDISRTKKRCGLAQNEYKGRAPSAEYYVPKHRDSKETLVMEAFRHFGLIDNL